MSTQEYSTKHRIYDEQTIIDRIPGYHDLSVDHPIREAADELLDGFDYMDADQIRNFGNDKTAPILDKITEVYGSAAQQDFISARFTEIMSHKIENWDMDDVKMSLNLAAGKTWRKGEKAVNKFLGIFSKKSSVQGKVDAARDKLTDMAVRVDAQNQLLDKNIEISNNLKNIFGESFTLYDNLSFKMVVQYVAIKEANRRFLEDETTQNMDKQMVNSLQSRFIKKTKSTIENLMVFAANQRIVLTGMDTLQDNIDVLEDYRTNGQSVVMNQLKTANLMLNVAKQGEYVSGVGEAKVSLLEQTGKMAIQLVEQSTELTTRDDTERYLKAYQNVTKGYTESRKRLAEHRENMQKGTAQMLAAVSSKKDPLVLLPPPSDNNNMQPG